MSVQNKLKKPEFSRGVMGYSAVEVDRYIDRVISRYNDVCRENAMLKEKLSILGEINSLREELNACQARFEAESAAKPDLAELRNLISAENERRKDFESCLIGFISDVFAKEEEGRASFESSLSLSLEKLGVPIFDDTAEADEAETDEAEADEAEADEAEADEAEADTTEADEAEADEAETDTAEPDGAETDEAEADLLVGEGSEELELLLDEAMAEIETALATIPESRPPISLDESVDVPLGTVEVMDGPVICTATPPVEVADSPVGKADSDEAELEVEFFDVTDALTPPPHNDGEPTPLLTAEEQYALDFYTDDELKLSSDALAASENEFSDDAIKKALEMLVAEQGEEDEAEDADGAVQESSDFYIPGEAKDYGEEDPLFKDLQKLMDLIEDEYPEKEEAADEDPGSVPPAAEIPEAEDLRTPAERAAALDFYTDNVHEDGESFDAMTLAARHAEKKRPTYRDFFGNIIDAGMTDND